MPFSESYLVTVALARVSSECEGLCTEREHSTWFKILNREYSQKEGREELFERDRHREPVAGWHTCVVACEEMP
jgi:hypothetical protein